MLSRSFGLGKTLKNCRAIYRLVGYNAVMKQNLAQQLGLTRPVVVFDLETTGLSVTKDRILQIAYQISYPDGKNIEECVMINPTVPISKEASDVHGFSEADVANAPTFLEKSKELFALFNNAYYSGFNISGFDLPMIREEFRRSGLEFKYMPDDILDAKLIYHYMERRDLASAYKFYCGKEHIDAHDALGDVLVTAEIIEEQIKRYGYDEVKRIHEEVCRDYIDAEGKFYRQDNEIYFNFSKFKGRSIASVAQTDPTFLRWILQADFADDTKDVVRSFINEQKKQ